MTRPTGQVYGELEQAYDHFNRLLFDGELPAVIITLQRKKGARGYCSRLRFANRDSQGQKATEIAMNPAYFGVRTIRETLSTLTHESCHVWQFHFGQPGRRGYHNKEWADKMEAIGLMPSDTGEPGGARTGEHMTHYIIPGGPFDRACDALLTEGFTLSWFDRYAPPEYIAALRAKQASRPGADGVASTPPSSATSSAATVEIEGPEGATVEGSGEPPKAYKRKYTCPGCGVNAWGKPALNLICGNCSLALMAG